MSCVGWQPSQRPADDALASIASDQPHPDMTDPTRSVLVDRETGRRPGFWGVRHDDLVDRDGSLDRHARWPPGPSRSFTDRDGSPTTTRGPHGWAAGFERPGRVWADCTAVTGDVELRQRVRDQARAWLAVDPDLETRAELQEILDRGDDARLEEMFAGSLEFGTAGLRARMGPGPRAMNRVVVRRATAGLMRTLPAGAVVVIGHDSRKNSKVFALDAARVVAGFEGRALLLPENAPTPLVAFAVRHLGADAGVVCTASHNPPGDNGFKVFLSDGAQVVPPGDARIAAAIADVDTDLALVDDDDGRVEHLDATIEDAYLDHIAGLRPVGARRPNSSDARIVYSPLHGVGAALTLAAFDRAGLAPPIVVDAQREPDGLFPTVATPNPEDPDATQLAWTRLSGMARLSPSSMIPTPTGSVCWRQWAAHGVRSPATRSGCCWLTTSSRTPTATTDWWSTRWCRPVHWLGSPPRTTSITPERSRASNGSCGRR